MTRFNDSDRRATSRGRDRDVSMSLGSAVRRQACVVALGALLSFFGGNGVEAAQNRSIAQIFPPQNRKKRPPTVRKEAEDAWALLTLQERSESNGASDDSGTRE